ncbi:class I SAM-dependent methyltransferase [Angustibacter luteus]|uniref:Class I SAM-dependent methyltransferase n=1 Tax=Angustibacter luteus TaxID=658456 RepID=A0ABW1JJQ6_9ACTN
MPRPQTRWIAETGGRRGPAYAARFRELAASGADLHGEARFLDGLLVDAGRTPARVLDAGTGTGRVAIELARRGHDVTGVDVDESMVVEARADGRQAGVDVRWVVGDLLDLADLAGGGFDLVAAPGNVLVYLADGTEPDVVMALAAALAPGGHLVVGFAADRHVDPDAYQGWCADAGLVEVARYASWSGDPWVAGGEFVVAVHRR